MKKNSKKLVCQYLVWLTGAISRKPTFLVESGTDVLSTEYINNIQIGALEFNMLSTELDTKKMCWIIKHDGKVFSHYKMTPDEALRYKKHIATQVTKALTQ